MKSGQETCSKCSEKFTVEVSDDYSLEQVFFSCPYCGYVNGYFYFKIAWVWDAYSKMLHTKLIGRYDAYAYRFDYMD